MGAAIAEYRLKEDKSYKYTNELELKLGRL